MSAPGPTPPRVELLYFAGCPHVEAARENVRAALDRSSGHDSWIEWDLEEPSTPAELRRYGSPTVLVSGRDVLGAAGGGAGLSCRAAGAPSVQQIVHALVGLDRK